MNLLAEMAQCWTTHLWSTSLQVTVLIFLVSLISLCFKRFPARYRYILWLLVLIRLAFPIPITSPLGIGQFPERFIAGGVQWISGQQSMPSPQSPIGIPEAAEASIGNTTEFSLMAGRVDDPVPFLFLIWLSGVFVISIAVVIRILLYRRRTRMLRPVIRPDLVDVVHRLKKRLNIKGAVRLFEAGDADGIHSPSVHGIVRTTLIIPADMIANWKIDALEPLLLHELVHIKRRDCLVNFLQIVLQVLYFYHPMVWFANWTIRRERELACDDDVIRYGTGCPKAYVRSMLRLAETVVLRQRRRLPGIAMAEKHSNLGRRIRRMMNKDYGADKRSGFVYFGVIFTLGLFCVAMSAQKPERPASLDPEAMAKLSALQEQPDTAMDPNSSNQADFSDPSDKILMSMIQASEPQGGAQSYEIRKLPTKPSMVKTKAQVRTEIPGEDSKIVLVSDYLKRVSDSIYRLTGNVFITYHDMVITCDKAEYDGRTRRLRTHGQTRFSQNSMSLVCSRAEFDLDKQIHTFYDASGNGYFHDDSGRTEQQYFFKGTMVLKNGDDALHISSDAVIEKNKP